MLTATVPETKKNGNGNDEPSEILQWAKDLVQAQIISNQISGLAVNDLLKETVGTLTHLVWIENGGDGGKKPAVVSPGTPSSAKNGQPNGRPEWKGSIKKHSVTCLECGKTFKQLSLRHLSQHELDPRTYRIKHGIPRTQALSAIEVTTRRRELAQQIKPWEKVPAKKPGSGRQPKATAKTTTTAKK